MTQPGGWGDPDSLPTHAVVETHALTEAVRRVALVAERNTPVRLTFSDGAIALEAGQGEDAQASEASAGSEASPAERTLSCSERKRA